MCVYRYLSICSSIHRYIYTCMYVCKNDYMKKDRNMIYIYIYPICGAVGSKMIERMVFEPQTSDFGCLELPGKIWSVYPKAINQLFM